jgi:hypothetical protein
MKSKTISEAISNSRNNTKVPLLGGTGVGEDKGMSGEDVGDRDGRWCSCGCE